MSLSVPLTGRTIVVTRPRAQADDLAEMITRAGGRALCIPLLEIEAIPDQTPLQAAAAQLQAGAALAIFISPNAVQYSLPTLLAQAPWPAGVQVAAVGEGTARALRAAGLGAVLFPEERFDSEALLELPPLQPARIAGQTVFIFRGEGGRTLLADGLRERGARVIGVPCYRRNSPAGGFSALYDLWRDEPRAAMILTSSEGLRNLWLALDAEGQHHLAEMLLFVPHARIEENARALGLQNIVRTSAGDTGIFTALCAYNWLQS